MVFLFSQPVFPELLQVRLLSPKVNHWESLWQNFGTFTGRMLKQQHRSTEGRVKHYEVVCCILQTIYR